jgi:hypothetical protein
MAIDRTGGPSGINPTNSVPSNDNKKDFTDQLKNKSTEDVAKLAMDKGMQPWQRQEAMKELVNRAAQMLADPNNDMDEKEKKALKDLMKMFDDAAKGKGDKNNIGELLTKLLEAMHVPSDIAQAIGQGLGGGGDAGSEGDE